MKRNIIAFADGVYWVGLVLIFMALVLGACASQPGVSPNEATPPEESAGAAGGMDSYASFVQAVESTGAQVEPAGEAQPGFFDLNSQVIKVNGADVQVMEFPNEAARQAASDTISPDGSQIGTSIIRWIAPPHFWGNGRLIVLYVGTEPAVIDLLTEVLGPSITS